MSLNEPKMQDLGGIENGLAGSDPRLASMLNIFSRLAAGEEMPVRENIRVRRRRPAAPPRRARRHPRRGAALPRARRLYPRLGLQQAVLLLWVVITAGMVAVALVLNTSGHQACTRSMGTACLSPGPTAAPVAPSGEGITAPRHSTGRAPLGDAPRRPGFVSFPKTDQRDSKWRFSGLTAIALTKGITVEWKDPS